MGFELPPNFVSGIGSNATSFFATFSPLVQLVLGLLLVTAIVAMLINAVKK